MKIIKANFEVKDVPLKAPVKVSFGTITSATTGFITIELENGIKGLGEISNIEYITKVSNDVVFNDVKGNIESLINKDINDFRNIIQSLNISMPALCGFDMSLFDAYAKLNNKSIAEIIGTEVTTTKPTNYTIGIMSKEDTVDKVKEMLNEGKTNIKIKVGNDINKDIETLNYLFENLPELEIRVDANQGYTMETFDRFMNEIDQSKILLIEEPFKMGEYDLLKQAQDKYPNAFLLADETASTVKDAEELAKRKACKGFNIKLIKCGGILNAVKMNEIAKKAGIKVMVGCMTETKLALSAAANFVLSDNNIISCDLDAFAFLKNEGGINSSIEFNKTNIFGKDFIGIGVK